MRKLLLLSGCLLGIALFLAACGGGESDEDKIANVIETAATSTDPADCETLQTQAFTEQTTQSSGSEAVESCEREAEEEEGAEEAEASNIEVEGSSASADVALTGGGFGGQVLTVSLVKEGDQWKLDEVAEIKQFDAAQLAQSFEEQFSESKEVNPQLASCIVEVFEEVSKEEAEELLLSGSREPLEELIEECS